MISSFLKLQFILWEGKELDILSDNHFNTPELELKVYFDRVQSKVIKQKEVKFSVKLELSKFVKHS